MLHIGTHRYVLVVGDVVMKFPRLHLIDYFDLILFDIKHRKHRSRIWTRWRVFKMMVFSGIMENVREARCSLQTKHSLLATLYLPLIFVNIYKREEGVGYFTFKGEELMSKVHQTGDRGFTEALLKCSHTFDHVENFAFSKGYVKILDYGEKGFLELLEKYGNKVETLLLSTAKRPT